MTDNKQKNRTGGSVGIIPERRGDGVARPSRTVPGDISGAADAGQENNQQQCVKIINMDQRMVERNASGAVDDCKKNNQQQGVKIKDTPPRLVERATALRGLSICSARDSQSTCRKRTELALHSPYAEVPYIKTE